VRQLSWNGGTSWTSAKSATTLTTSEATYTLGTSTAYRYLGLATMAAGRYVEAQSHLQKSLEIFGEYFKGWDIARTLGYLGDATLLAGNAVDAGKVYRDALRVSLEAKSIPIALDVLVGLAHVRARSGNSELALELCRHILNHPASTHEAKDRAHQLSKELEARQAPQQIEAARARARTKPFDKIVEEILEARGTSAASS